METLKQIVKRTIKEYFAPLKGIKRYYFVAYEQADKGGSFSLICTSWFPNHTKAQAAANAEAKSKVGEKFQLTQFNYLGWTL